VGLVVDCCTVKIVNPNTHKECRWDEEGEIQVRGDNVMLGYWDDPQSSAEVIEDGWLKTGDLGHFDRDGFLVLTGRIKNIIILQNGKNISPEEIESMLQEHAMIKEVVVTAGSGDNIRAIIVPDDVLSAAMSPEMLTQVLQKAIDQINDRLPYYKHVAEFTVRKTEFEKTTTKKIMRYKV